MDASSDLRADAELNVRREERRVAVWEEADRSGS